MEVYRVALDFGGLFAAPQKCPRCGEIDLVAVADDERTEFRCNGCRQVWVRSAPAQILIVDAHGSTGPPVTLSFRSE